MEKLNEFKAKFEELKNGGDDIIKYLLLFNDICETYPELSNKVIKDTPELKQTKALLDMSKLIATASGKTLEEQLKEVFEEDTPEQNTEDTIEDEIDRLPEGYKFLISYVYDDEEEQLYNATNRCFISTQGNVTPKFIINLEKGIEKKKGYTNVKIVNLIELD